MFCVYTQKEDDHFSGNIFNATSDPHHARKQTKADDTYAKKHTRRLEEVESSHDESERPHKQRRPGFYVFS